jgi:hypothetical protein
MDIPSNEDPKKPIIPEIDFRGYRGNPLIKRDGIQINWTPDMLAEYIKCSQDPIYFLETYMKIIHPDDGLIPFNMWDFQKQMLRNFQEWRENIVLTARQVGKSTTTCGFILWYIIFHSEKTVALLANKGETAREILGKIQLAYQHLPKWLQHGVIEWNKGSFLLENNSRVIAAATSADNIRGYSVSLLFIDEAAIIENWEEFSTSVLPTISSGKSTKIILVSTPKGLNHFHKIWKDSEEGENEYCRIEVKWDMVPGRDEAWKKKVLADLGNDTEKFDQEYNCEFMGSSGTLISGAKLKSMVHRRPINQEDGLHQFYKPIRGHKYVIVVDPSEGKGLDSTAFSVFDITEMPYEQVCSYQNKWTPIEDMTTIVHQTAIVYNNAWVLVETNVLGNDICKGLWYGHEYTNVVQTENAGRDGKRVSAGFKKRTEFGVKTTAIVKSKGCSYVKQLIEADQLILNDHRSIYEFSKFSRRNASTMNVTYCAEPGAHDDLVMTCVLFAWFCTQPHFEELTEINTIGQMKQIDEEEYATSLMPFAYVTSGRPGEDEDILTDDFMLGAIMNYEE